MEQGRSPVSYRHLLLLSPTVRYLLNCANSITSLALCVVSLNIAHYYSTVLNNNQYTASINSSDAKGRFPLPEFTARVHGPS